MAIDLKAIRSRLDALKSKTTKQENLWKPKEGKQTIRIVPYQYDKSNPFVELYFHYNLGKKTYLSPQSKGMPDPIIEFSEKLKSTGDRDDWKMAMSLTPKMRTHVPVIVRGEEREGVKFWGFGKTVYQELLGIIADPDYGDITDLQNGRDVQVEFTPGSGNESFAKTTIRVKPNQTSATDDKEIAQLILKEQPKIDDVFPEVSYEELKSALENWLNPNNGDDNKSIEGNSKNKSVETEKSDTKKDYNTKNGSDTKKGIKSTADVDKAFEDLFKE